MNNKTVNIGDYIFSDIDNNPYLNSLYDKLLIDYAKFRLCTVNNSLSLQDKDILDLLRFADLLSKSTHKQLSEKHKIRAQEIIILLNQIFPNNKEILYYTSSVYYNTNNSRGATLLKVPYKDSFILEEIFNEIKKNSLRIPTEEDKYFFPVQKNVYKHMQDSYFSFSAPTSMGKSFLMRLFIKENILEGNSLNFAIVVPTKALINELSKKLIEDDLKSDLVKYNYKVITTSNHVSLKSKHNFIFVVTPERLLYILITYPQLVINYLFVDEAHKISAEGSRSSFYYKVIDILKNHKTPPKFIFASPNIPNPDVYIKLIDDNKGNNLHSIRTCYSPVSQFKFFMDFINHDLKIYNPYTKNALKVCSTNTPKDIFTADVLHHLNNISQKKYGIPCQTVVFYNSKDKVVQAAVKYASQLKSHNDKTLKKLSEDIAKIVHQDYYLAEILTKGVAYHIGYLPSSIRLRIEKLFKQGKITTLFCTSTLLEGVNLPADYLIITTNKISRSKMTPVDFNNLIGRVGRIEYNLCGNVIFLSESTSNIRDNDYMDLLNSEIPQQELSISPKANILTPKVKKYVIDMLKSGSTEFKKLDGQTKENYSLSRKIGLILVKDILDDNNSIVRKSFSDVISNQDVNIIKRAFQNSKLQQDHDINVSADQIENLSAAIKKGLKYPTAINGYFRYNDILAFLEKLCKVFKWEIYEKDTLGKVFNQKHSKLRWYSTLLLQWINGNPLNRIIQSSLDYYKKNRPILRIQGNPIKYDDSKEARNVVLTSTLEAIDNVILYSLSNYFLRFSNEYKNIHQVSNFPNDWYEYVEYGSTDPISIQLQRLGFSREVASFITQNDKYIILRKNDKILLSKDLIHASDKNVSQEASQISLNMPEYFK